MEQEELIIMVKMGANPNGKAIRNVRTGTMLTKAHAKVADVY